MFKYLVVSIVTLSAALLFGFVTAAVMATNLGLVIVGTIAALLVMSGIFQSTQMFAQTHHA